MAELAFEIAEAVLEKLASKAYEEISLAKSAKDDLKKLVEFTAILKSKLKDAEKKQNQKDNEELRIWLVKLKHVLNDAMDVLDEFDCEVVRCHVVEEYGTVGRKVRRFCSGSNPVVFRFSIAHRVKGIKERLDKITQDMARFQLIDSQLNIGHEEQSHLSDRRRNDRETHSFIEASEVIGRDGDKAEVIDRLMGKDDCDGNNSLSLVPIVGIGGLGKTTLAKLVFNDENVRGRFELRIWVCVSLDFDVTHLLREILKSATNTKEDISSLSLDQLQTSVRTTLEGKRFLLVLDDVWNKDRVKWTNLRQFLTVGAEGSKVIVTTRGTEVSSIMTKAPPHILQGFSTKDSLSLFFRCSFGVEKHEERDQSLEDIGKQIVKKCGGVPLALTTLGSLLYSRPEAEWISVRDNKIWEMEQEDKYILPALQLSYNAMPSCMKRCFAYCSIFREDTQMSGFELTLIWMALGILQDDGKLELEDVGRTQFEGLCDRSFLQRLTEDEEDKEKTICRLLCICNMHDLVHDLARSITKSECYIVKYGNEDISDSVRFLRLFMNKNSQTIVRKFKNLWSIHLDHTAEENDVLHISESFLTTCIKNSRHLRLFDLQYFSFEVLPSSIGTLKHLRYLNLSGNRRIKRLPNSICKLQSLQTLLLHGCEELEELPKDMRNLISLRTLFITTKQAHFPERGIGCLKSLRMLSIVGCNNLRSLPHDMINCATLRHLLIFSCEKLDLENTDDVVNPLSLQTFQINELPQMTTLPQWLKGASNTLKNLVIEHCNKLVVLPKWLQDFRLLERLVIKYCKDLELASKHEGIVRLKLKIFIIENLPNATSLPSWVQGASHSLQVLKIKSCKNLVSLPEWLSNIVSLKKLVIEKCEELSALPEGILQRLTSLTNLVIENCDKLTLLNESFQGIHLSLKDVSIIGVQQMTNPPEWLQGASHTLESLRISSCRDLSVLPEWLPDITSLKRLVILHCLKLSSLPEGMSRLTSLTHLEIRLCSDAFQHRYKPEIGEDWESIAHIPNVHIADPFYDPFANLVDEWGSD